MDTQDKDYGIVARSDISGAATVRSLPRSASGLVRDFPAPEAPNHPSRKSPATSRSPRHVSRTLPATRPDSLEPTDARRQRARHYRIRKLWTWPQLVGGVLIASICVVCAVWYVPRVMSNDRRLLTGTATSSGVITLNFADAGEIQKLNVRLGQTVRKGQVLATEYAPNVNSFVAAQTEVIASDKAKIASIRAALAPGAAVLASAQLSGDEAQLTAEKAQLALDEAQLVADRAKVAATEIIAPSSGSVVAANGQSGENVTSSGIRDYVADSEQPPAAQRPEFSLLPEGPQSVRRASGSDSALPVIALRTSTTWQVVALIPEAAVSSIRSGQGVTISVPAAQITDIVGKIDAVLPTPIATPEGTAYQAVVAITGHPTNLPLNGMAADIQLGS